MADLPTSLRLVIFDLDGVVYRGTEPVPGAADLIRTLRAAGVAVRFATNNSMIARAGYVDALGAIGIPTVVEELVTSTSATIDHLHRHAPDVHRVMAVGTVGMVEELTAGGFAVTAAAEAVEPGYDGRPLDERYDAVVAGLDPAIDYRRLAAAASAVRAGARFIATNADVRYPTPRGFLPGAGAIVAAIAAVTGVEPEVIGKPQPAMFRAILESTGIDAAEALVIGDNPDADMVAARRAGIAAALVLTGVADRAAVAGLTGERRPDLVAEDPGALAALLDGRLS
jgi:4-nitrophenyl phosphatase